ncbi:MAG: site-2 protease family protein [Candidatus Coproplasma sp.]
MKITIHPLFFGVIIFSAFTGGFFECLIFALTALLHECGHIFCAARLGFKCEKIKLMPYGAASVCNLDGIRVKDEVALALAGPAVNAAICVICAGLWWFFPETYAYTDTVMAASLVMLAVNLLPAYPLDGGRVARCVLIKLFTQRMAYIVLRIINAAIAVAFFVLFFFSGFNLTFIFFSLFLICSALEKPPQAIKINFSSRDKLKRGMEVKYVLVDASFTYKDAMRYLDDKEYLVLQLYDDGVADEISQDELYANLASHTIYDRVFDG